MTKPADSVLAALLDQGPCHPVLADVGAAGRRQKIWDSIASRALIVGFDPDRRQADPEFSKAFGHAVMIDKAVVADQQSDQAEFILTAYPSCSSLLEGDEDVLSEWSFGPLFAPVGRGRVAATSLDRVVKEHDLPGIDWLKLDTQGCDLKILEGLSPALLDALLVVDVEPGFSAFYRGEDKFADVHAFLQQKQFWLCDIHCQAYAKVRGTSLARFAAREAERGRSVDVERLWRRLPPSPTAAEARYLRSVESVLAGGDKRARALKAFVFALMIDKPGYALDVYWAADDAMLFSAATLNVMYEALKAQLEPAPAASVPRAADSRGRIGRLKSVARQWLARR